MPSTPEPPPTPPNPGDAPRNVERALALRDVMTHAATAQREYAKPQDAPRSNRGRIAVIVCAPLLALSAWSFVARPEFIWGPREAAVDPVRAEASGRVGLFFIAQKLDEYRDAEGEYPASLAAVGLEDPSVGYTRLADTLFELRSRAAAKVLVLRSTDNYGDFVAPAVTGRAR